MDQKLIRETYVIELPGGETEVGDISTVIELCNQYGIFEVVKRETWETRKPLSLEELRKARDENRWSPYHIELTDRPPGSYEIEMEAYTRDPSEAVENVRRIITTYKNLLQHGSRLLMEEIVTETRERKMTLKDLAQSILQT
ncbi:MAG: hypothetical protein GXO63_00450 [Candidatus Micrarchaeota archaeon]|nr:hypothetical protein [Candidatus Micrarchaeota archaeon]